MATRPMENGMVRPEIIAGRSAGGQKTALMEDALELTFEGRLSMMACAAGNSIQ